MVEQQHTLRPRPLTALDEAARDPGDEVPPKALKCPSNLRPPIDFNVLSRLSV